MGCWEVGGGDAGISPCCAQKYIPQTHKKETLQARTQFVPRILGLRIITHLGLLHLALLQLALDALLLAAQRLLLAPALLSQLSLRWGCERKHG